MNSNNLRAEILFLFLIFALFQIITSDDNQLCKDQTDGTFIKDPKTCENFYQCRNGEPLLASCPDGMYFDSKSGICDIAENVFCKHDHIDDDDDFDEIIECPQEGNEKQLKFIASKFDCKRYYICYHGVALKQECIPELHWNDKTKKCDFPHKAKCTAIQVRCDNEFMKKTLPHPIDCSLYYYCIRGVPLVQRCPYFHHFDLRSRSCQWQNRAQCWANEKSKDDKIKLKKYLNLLN